MSGSTLSEQLAAFAVSAFQEGAPTDVRESVRQRVLDVTGLQLAALDLPTSEGAVGFTLSQGGPAESRIIGHGGAISAAGAAFANGVLAHSLDFDDTHLPSVLHPSASVVPAVLAVAEAKGVRGPQILDAIAVGIEVTVRLGMAGYDRAARSSIYFEHGQHATSICGTVGSAVAAALIVDGTEKGLVDAIGLSASMASGIIEANRTGGTVKRMHCGWSAKAGATAAELRAHGFTGPPTALEGRFGLFEAFLHGNVHLDEVTDGLGERWEVPGIFFKPYPANHFTHTGLDAARELRERGVRIEDIADIRLGVATSTIRTIGEPIERKRAPETGYQAQFSGPYMVALGFLGGGGPGASLDDFADERLRDPARLELMSKVSVVADADCDAIFPDQFPAVLTVTTHDGQEHVAAAMSNRGGGMQPLTEDELRTKFRDNARRRLDAAGIAAVEAAVVGLAGTGGVGELTAACAGEAE